ncbi:hypothetical protein CAPTEDRAFT_126689 [Capitella teleta]|uniref:RING-type domain-containing protein n=1 Tax=Capitella teleta TaxID=283909 RepID=R7UCE6_CAPTE|nr:hypothetical protein CAPTEDRAFT_126689 [Capitella teleta]|eukprot:ELU04050.1 hypothetical protein CAPTEDRAFT_126689 [Capitella teleta]
MHCDGCSLEFSIFQRKRNCADCSLIHCSDCLVKEPFASGFRRRCRKCRLLASGNFTRKDLAEFKVKELRAFLDRRSVSTQNCMEKADFVEAVFKYSDNSHYRQEQVEKQRHLHELQERRRLNASRAMNRESPVPPDSPASSHSSRGPEEAPPRIPEPPSYTEPVRASLDHLVAVGDIEELSVRQLKEILATNFVDYKGCVEKWELMERVKRLWHSDRANKEKNEEINDNLDNNDLCKICMDAIIDCVLLECGHMVTCTKCGRRMAECPICRQYVVRVVHIFKA